MGGKSANTAGRFQDNYPRRAGGSERKKGLLTEATGQTIYFMHDKIDDLAVKPYIVPSFLLVSIY